MARQGNMALGILVLCGLGLLVLATLSVVEVSRGGKRPAWMQGPDRLAVVELVGPILDSRRLVAVLKEYREDASVKAVVLRIDSPGGGVTASHEIFEAVRRVREAGKPVIASMGAVAASGGYYVACGADSILANPGTITGSIGVIIELTSLVDLFRTLGIGVETIKSGPLKDAGSPHRELLPEERAYLQGVIDDSFEQFLDVVARARVMDRDRLRTLADGRIYTGRQALALGLVDRLGDYEDAVTLARRAAGLAEDAPVIGRRRQGMGLLDLLLRDLDAVAAHLTPWPALWYRLR